MCRAQSPAGASPAFSPAVFALSELKPTPVRRAARRLSFAFHVGLLGAFVGACFAPTANATGIESSVLTTQLADLDCGQPPSTHTFLLSDPRITYWVSLSDVRVGDEYGYVWIDPSGKVFNRHMLQRDEEADQTCSWSSLSLANGLASSRPGRWKVQFYYNGALQREDRFQVVASGRVVEMGLQAAATSPDPQASRTTVNTLIQQVFETSDRELVLSARVAELRAGDTLSVTWLDGAGVVRQRDELPMPTAIGEYLLASNLKLLPPAVVPEGLWKVEVAVNGQVRESLSFWIRGSQPPLFRGALETRFGDGPAPDCAASPNPIETFLHPIGSRTYRDPDRREERTLLALLDALSRGAPSTADTLARGLNLSISRQLDPELGSEVYVIEPLLRTQLPGPNLLAFFRPDGNPGLIVEIPRPGSDARTMDFGLAMLREGASLVIVSGAEAMANYRPSGRLETPPCQWQSAELERVPGLDESAVWRNEESLFQAAHTWAVERALRFDANPLVVQPGALAGETGDACDLAVSVVARDPALEGAVSAELVGQLGRYALSGSPGRRLTAVATVDGGEGCSRPDPELSQNVQARHTRWAGGVFVQLGLDEGLRTWPADANASQVARAILDTYRLQLLESPVPKAPAAGARAGEGGHSRSTTDSSHGSSREGATTPSPAMPSPSTPASLSPGHQATPTATLPPSRDPKPN